MNDVDTLGGSGDRLSFYKLFAEKNFTVEIPIIQRDYAQGRVAEHEVRRSFLDALYNYLDEGKPNRDLDFVYGSLLGQEGSFRFVPLDGQQRLTTLFLLHWYLAQLAKQSSAFRAVVCKKNRSRFRYETRSSSSEFCDALITYELDMEDLPRPMGLELNKLSDAITDTSWFHSSWIKDPTIQSMLRMLDAIHVKFSERPDFFDRLISEDQPTVTFLFLNLKQFSLTDDLYIKMNARGKPLTPFENFKANFEKEIERFRESLPRYPVSFSEEPVDGYEYFAHKIDTDWADVFWAYRDASDEENVFDKELMNFLGLIFANFVLLEPEDQPLRVSIRVNQLFENRGLVKQLSFQSYKDLGCITQDLITHLIEVMDLIHNGGLANNQITTHLDDRTYYDEEDIFKKALQNETSYQEKLRFHAFYDYVSTWGAGTGLDDWLRVVYNLTENTVINTADEYKRTLIALSELRRKDQFILDALRADCEIAAFNGAQILEEKIKAHLLAKSEAWRAAVVSSEQHSFFKGQIGFALNFSGILDFYQVRGNCEWSDEENEFFFDTFNKYATAGCSVFSEIAHSSSKIDYLWERAVLTKGIYFTETSANRFNMLSSRVTKNNIERDHSWKRLLRISLRPDAQLATKQSYVKAVFDDAHFDPKNIQGSLRRICATALERGQLEPWKLTMIKHKELFNECNQGFIAMNSGEVILLHESQRNHYHSELFTRELSLELELEQIQPFSSINYTNVRNRDDSASVDFGYWVFRETRFKLEVVYRDHTYKTRFFSSEDLQNGIDDSLQDVLTECELVRTEAPNEHGISFLHQCETKAAVTSFLTKLFTELKFLTDE